MRLKITKKNAKNFFNVILEKSQEVPVLVQFYTNWCGPCQTLKPIIEGAAKKANGKWVLAMVNVEEYQGAAMIYKIRSVPTVLLFHKGEPIASFKGVKPETMILNWVETQLPKRKRKSKYGDAEIFLNQGNVDEAMSNLITQLHKDQPQLEMANILMAIHSIGKNNNIALQALNGINQKGEFKQLIAKIRAMIEMDVDEKDPHTPNHSPYNPKASSADSMINLRAFDEGLMTYLVTEGINDIRKSKGLVELKKNNILRAAAKDHNNYQMKHDVLTHQQKSARKKNVKERVHSFGGKFRVLGENVQYQGMQVIQRYNRVEIIPESYSQMAEKIVDNWVKSPGHYRNLIHPHYSIAGLAIGWNPENHSFFATHVFGG